MKMDLDSECEYVIFIYDGDEQNGDDTDGEEIVIGPYDFDCEEVGHKRKAEAFLPAPTSKKQKMSEECRALKVPDRWDKMAAELRALFAAGEDTKVIHVPFDETEAFHMTSEDEASSETTYYPDDSSWTSEDSQVLSMTSEDEAFYSATEETEASKGGFWTAAAEARKFMAQWEADHAEQKRLLAKWKADGAERERMLNSLC